MNEYDLKTIILSTLFSGVALLVAVWGYHAVYEIPFTITNMLSGTVSGVTVLIILICYLKLRELRRFESGEKDNAEV
jgi:hypothetical protein